MKKWFEREIKIYNRGNFTIRLGKYGGKEKYGVYYLGEICASFVSFKEARWYIEDSIK